jgi:hypothetical protein
MKMLRSRLYEMELEKKRAESKAIEDAKMDIAWGSQIRSYVLHPYRLAKDHRTKLEMGDVDRVLNGDLDTVHQGVPGLSPRCRQGCARETCLEIVRELDWLPVVDAQQCIPTAWLGTPQPALGQLAEESLAWQTVDQTSALPGW